MNEQYVLDAALRRVLERVKALEVTVARARLAQAGNVVYDPATSGLTATDLQAAIDELEALIGTPSLALDDLTDVMVPSPADGEVLTYNDYLAQWEAAAPSGGSATELDDLTDVTITAPATGDMLRYSGTAWVNVVGRWEPVTTNPGGGPELVWSGDDIVMAWNPI